MRRVPDAGGVKGVAGLFRVLFVIPQAGVVTLLLLLMMAGLIEFSGQAAPPRERIRLPDIHMPELRETLVQRIEKPDRPEFEAPPPPELPRQHFAAVDADVPLGRPMASGRLQAQLELDIGGGFEAVDGEYLPIVKIAPQYPRRALNRGIEGYVVLEYTVTPQGTVRDPRVIEADPDGVFDKVAIESALRYKYRPRVVNGRPVAVAGVRTRISFELQK